MLGRSLLRWSRSLFIHRLEPHSSRRTFSTTPKPQIINEAVQTAQDYYQFLHFSDLSWAASIPLVAFTLRFGILAPVTLYTHYVNSERAKLNPLGFAYRQAIKNDVMREHGAQGPQTCQAIVVRRVAIQSRKLRKEMDVQYWKTFTGWIQFPIWLTMIEALRRMCGIREGLLGLAQKSINGVEEAEMSQESAIVAHNAEVAPEATVTTLDIVQRTSSTIPVETSLATEGMLWFPNLLEPDPYAMLSVALSATIWANIAYMDQRIQKHSPTVPSLWRQRVTRALYVAGAGAGFATLQLPSAMLLYWITSSQSALWFNIILDRYWPLERTITPQSVKPFEIKHPIKD